MYVPVPCHRVLDPSSGMQRPPAWIRLCRDGLELDLQLELELELARSHAVLLVVVLLQVSLEAIQS